MRFIDGIRARLRLLFAPGAAESRMEEELRFHVEMETERLEREEGLSADEARRRALVAFGGQDRYREEMRDGRGLAWLSGLRLDLKLGGRMLLKYPVLTFASVLALSVAFALAASWFVFMSNLAYPRIPLPESDRLVSLRNVDAASSATEMRSLHDFEIWREELASVRDLSATSAQEYTVTTEDERFATLNGARMTPSAFRLTRVEPLLGRSLAAEDGEPGAPPVAVIGHSAWQRLFDGERSAIGQTIRLGPEYATVVGVMPEGYGFPLNQEIWTALRESGLSYGPRAGPPIRMYGRLAPGVSVEEAQAELATIGQRVAAEFPATHEQLWPELRHIGQGNDEARLASLLNIPFLLFLVVVSANVAALLFARTAIRESEIALRSALGASRGRIILQLVAEALVLTSVAAVLGLATAAFGIRWGMDLFWEVQQMRPPFFFSSDLTASTVLYVFALAILGAVIIGGIPGARVTRGRLWHRLAEPGAGGSGMRFGRVATGVIVVQVALCVAFIPVAIMNGQELLEDRRSSDFPAEAFLTGRLFQQLDHPSKGPGTGADQQEGEGRAEELFDEANRRLAAAPSVLATTRASRLPGFNHPVEPLEIQGDSARTIYARLVGVDPNFFDVVSARIVDGRSFRPEDVTAEAGVAIVDREWAMQTYGGRNPVGQRIRYPVRDEPQDGDWHEIVGVVAGMQNALGPGSAVSVFRPLRPEEHASVQFYLRTNGDPDEVLPQVHSLVTAVDPGIGIADLKPLDEVWRPVQRSNVFFTVALGTVGAIILLFALIGIYALMSFTVAQRTREIGIRAALGADSRRLVVTIFSRAMGQIGLGVVVGAVLVSLTVADDPDGRRLVGVVAAAMVVVGLLGCLIPAMRALRIHPTEALRAE